VVVAQKDKAAVAAKYDAIIAGADKLRLTLGGWLKSLS
jgi:hypothetical protein